MIRLRNKEGEVKELEDSTRFVEVCSIDGDVAKVIFIDNHGNLKEVDSRDKDSKTYGKLYGVNFIPIIPIK